MAFLPLTTFITAFRTSLGKVEQSEGFAVSEFKIEVPAIVSTKGLEVLIEVPNPAANVTPDAAYLARLSMSFIASEMAGLSAGAVPQDPWKRLYSGVTESLHGVYAGKVTGMVYAVGKSGVVLWSSDGEVFGPATNIATVRLHAAWGSGAGEVCVVGDNGTMLRLASPQAAWVKLPNGPNIALNGIAGTGSGDVYAVGNGGTMLFSNHGGKSGTWTNVVSPVSYHLHAVWATSTNAVKRVCVVGAAGTILLSVDNAPFTQKSSGTTRDFFGVWGDATSNVVYAVGTGGKIVRSSDGGSTWIAQTSGVDENLYGVWGSGPEDVYVVGRNGTILHSADEGATWSPQKSGTTEALHSVAGIGPGEVWIVGAGGLILRRMSAT